MSFLPDGYEPPKRGGAFMKLAIGENRIRILDSPLLGFVGWKTKQGGKKSPVRKIEDKFAPGELDAGKQGQSKHFWAMPIWNYSDNRVQVMELTQATIQEAVKNLARNAKWGHPSRYDIVITASGEGMDRKYSIVPEPKEPLSEEATTAWAEVSAQGFDIKRLLTNGNPFGEGEDDEAPPPNDEDIPF